MTIPVVTPETIAAAIRSAEAGAAFKLVGTFGNLPLGIRKPDLTLDCTKAVITGELRQNGVQGLRLIGGLWTGVAPICLLSTAASGPNRDIVIEGGRFLGNPDNRVGDAMKFIDVAGLKVTDVVVDDYVNGLAISKIKGGAIEGTRFRGLRKDMIQAAGVSDLVIRNMDGRGSVPAEDDHPDGVQLRNLPGVWECSDILMEDLWLEGPIQPVVTTRKAADGFLHRITLRRARLGGGHPNGAGFLAVKGLTLEDVDVWTVPGSINQSRVYWRDDCTDVRLSGNVRHAAYGNKPGVVWSKPTLADADLMAQLSEAKASIASLQEINQRLAAQRDTYRASALEGVNRLSQIAELAKVSPPLT